MTHSINPIGYISTPFSQKFGIPRQGVGLSRAKGRITFTPDINPQESCSAIEEFSHLWLIFQFHAHLDRGWSSKVRPPRLGGNKKVGVFASRSSFRPNPIGMSVVKLVGLENNKLIVEGVDLLDGTPIIDIKPYLTYADSIEHAQCGFAHQAPAEHLIVEYTQSVRSMLNEALADYPDLKLLIESCLQQDPRPAYKQNSIDSKEYYLRLYNLDIGFTIVDKKAIVSSLKKT